MEAGAEQTALVLTTPPIFRALSLRGQRRRKVMQYHARRTRSTHASHATRTHRTQHARRTRSTHASRILLLIVIFLQYAIVKPNKLVVQRLSCCKQKIVIINKKQEVNENEKKRKGGGGGGEPYRGRVEINGIIIKNKWIKRVLACNGVT